MCNCAEIAVLIPGITIFQRKAYHSIPKDHHPLKNFAFHVPKLQSNFFIHCGNYLLKKVETKFLSEWADHSPSHLCFFICDNILFFHCYWNYNDEIHCYTRSSQLVCILVPTEKMNIWIRGFWEICSLTLYYYHWQNTWLLYLHK